MPLVTVPGRNLQLDALSIKRTAIRPTHGAAEVRLLIFLNDETEPLVITLESKQQADDFCKHVAELQA